MFFKVNPRKPVLPKPVPAPILTVPTGCCKQKHEKVTQEVVCISTRCRLYVSKILRYVLITLSAKTFDEIVMAMRVERVRRLACSKWRSNRAYISYISSFCTSQYNRWKDDLVINYHKNRILVMQIKVFVEIFDVHFIDISSIFITSACLWYFTTFYRPLRTWTNAVTSFILFRVFELKTFC